MPRLHPLAVFCVLTLVSASAASAQFHLTDAATQATCRQSLAQPPSPPALSGPLSAADLPDCDETALYYGLDQPRNLAAALQCGWYQLAHPNPQQGDPFFGAGVLSMIYANGDGVPRNLPLATFFVCSNTWAAPAEFTGRLEHLQHIRSALAAHTSPPDLHFDLCDDATSGLSEGACTLITTRRRSATRDVAIDALVRSYPAAAQRLFPQLQAAETRFEDIRSRNEVDLSGTGRAAFSLDEEAILADQFLINLQRLRRHTIPSASPADLTHIEAEVAASLARIRHAPASQWQDITINPTGIAETETAYSALIDAWLRFAAAAEPSLSPVSLRAQLLRLRLHQLRSLAG